MIWHTLKLPPINLYNAPKRKESDGNGPHRSTTEHS
jgi:hypothetical protein